MAKQNDVALVPGMLERGVEWLKRYQAEQVQLIKNAADQRQAARPAVEGPCRRAGRLRLHGAGRRRREERRDARVPLSRPHQAGRLRHGHVRRRPGQAGREGKAGHDPAATSASTSSRTTRTRPPGSSCPADCWWYWYGSEYEAQAYYLKLLGADRSQGRAGPAAGEVPAQQPQARHLLELDPRHGHCASRRWPTSSAPAARTGPR